MNSRLKALEATAFGQVASLFAEHGFREDMDRFVAESKVTDHHAIIPTEQRVDLSRFTKEERSLWELIALRFMEVLSEDYVYRTTRIEIKVANQQFMTRVSIPVKQGWRDMARLIGKRSAAAILDSDEGSSTTGTSFNVSDRLTVGAVRSRRTTTTPPERYTEASLLSAMEHAGRFVDDASLKKQLGGGLGTPATRADIIEKLIQNYYIERDGKYLKPTGKGRELIRLAPMQLRSPELTAKWEGRLSAIAEGEESAHQFIEDIKENAKQLVAQVASSKEQFRPRFSEGKTCPYCEAPMMKATDEFGQIHYICQRLSCSYEEALIKRRKQTAEKPTKAKRVVVQTKALPASSTSGKKVVVVKRSTGTTPAVDQWETITEVIHPSRYRRETYTQKTAPKRNTKDSATDRRSSNPYAAPESSGTTFADLLAASEKLKKERDKKRKS
jgi:DNA topoisomerase-3